MKLRVPPIARSFAPGACAAGGLTAVTAAPAAAATSTHTMTGPGTRGGIISHARAVNGNGDIAGGCNGDVFLGHHGKMTAPGRGEASGINGFGEIAGSTSGCPALLTGGGTRTTLPGRSSHAGGSSGAAGISNRHQVVAGAGNAHGYGHAVRGSSATITGPGTPGGTPGAGYAVNDLGQVTGWAPTGSEAPRVFLCSGGTVTGPGTFGLDPAGQAITNHGVLAARPGPGAWAWGGGTFHNLSNLIPARRRVHAQQRDRDQPHRPSRRRWRQLRWPRPRVPADPS